MTQQPGTVIVGRYRIEKLIGRGGMADVYLGSDLMLERSVAIKLLTDRSEIVRKRFLREAQSMASLNHPNIVAVYDAGDDSEQLYIVMELIEGSTLADAAKAGLAMRRAVEIFVSLLEALDYAHEQNVIHRDIKPANIMMLTDGTVKVMDFGLSRRVSDMSNVTQAGEIVGTIAYLSPERFLGRSTDARSDLYSVGVVMYEIFTGDVPFRSATEDLVAVIFAHVNEPPVPPRQKNRDLPVGLERIILKLLEKDPDARYAKAGQVAADLRALLAPSGPPTAPKAPAAPPPPDSAAARKNKADAAISHALFGTPSSPTQLLRDAQRDVLTGMLAVRKRDFVEAMRAFRAALDGFEQINNELEYARTAVKLAATVVEKNNSGDASSGEELESVLRALGGSIPILRGRRLFGELEEAERAHYFVHRLKVNATR